MSGEVGETDDTETNEEYNQFLMNALRKTRLGNGKREARAEGDKVKERRGGRRWDYQW